MLLYGRVIEPLTTRQLNLLAACASSIYDTLMNLRTVKLFRREEKEVLSQGGSL